MNKKLIVLIAASLLPAYANAAKLDLKQDLGGLDLVVAIEPPPPGDPVAIRITNKSKVVASCALSYPGADATMMNYGYDPARQVRHLARYIGRRECAAIWQPQVHREEGRFEISDKSSPALARVNDEGPLVITSTRAQVLRNSEW